LTHYYVTKTKAIVKYSPPVTTKTKTIVDNLLFNLLKLNYF